MMEIDGEQFLTEEEWASFRGIKRESLRVARSRGNDAPFIRMAGRRVVYRKSAVLAWLKDREVTSDAA